VSVQDEGGFDSSSLKALQNKAQFGCFCMYVMFLGVMKRMKFRTNLIFRICLLVACGFMKSLMDMTVIKFSKPTFFQVARVFQTL